MLDWLGCIVSARSRGVALAYIGSLLAAHDMSDAPYKRARAVNPERSTR
nr:hypothetical protein [Candidatus Chloroploca sp. Khr17]